MNGWFHFLKDLFLKLNLLIINLSKLYIILFSSLTFISLPAVESLLIDSCKKIARL